MIDGICDSWVCDNSIYVEAEGGGRRFCIVTVLNNRCGSEESGKNCC